METVAPVFNAAQRAAVQSLKVPKTAEEKLEKDIWASLTEIGKTDTKIQQELKSSFNSNPPSDMVRSAMRFVAAGRTQYLTANQIAFAIVYVCSLWKNHQKAEGEDFSPCDSMQTVTDLFKLTFSPMCKGTPKWIQLAKDFSYNTWDKFVIDRISNENAIQSWSEYMSYPNLWGGFGLFKRFLQRLADLTLVEANTNNVTQVYNLLVNEQKLKGNVVRCYEEAYDRPQDISTWMEKVSGSTVLDVDRMFIYKDCEDWALQNNAVINKWNESQWAIYMVYNLCKALNVESESLKQILLLFEISMEHSLYVSFLESCDSFIYNGASMSSKKRARPSSSKSDIYNDILIICLAIDTNLLRARSERKKADADAESDAELEAELEAALEAG